jgi:hypothetical protein
MDVCPSQGNPGINLYPITNDRPGMDHHPNASMSQLKTTSNLDRARDFHAQEFK